MARLLISATRKSSGKTTLSLGLCVAYRNLGLSVQPFKKGPDYIDPLWLSAGSGRSCYNLDFNTMGSDEMLGLFGRCSRDADLSLIEGTKGLYDGVDVHGSDSNAALADLLQSPVLLVMDVEGITRGVVPIVQGYQAFGPDIDFAGVILNNYRGSRHLAKLRAAMESYTDIPVLGAVPRNSDIRINERHLGLTTNAETADPDRKLKRLGSLVRDCVDLDLVRKQAGQAPPLSGTGELPASGRNGEGLQIGIARDSAFCFYYPDDLDEMRRQGATLHFFDTLKDSRLPDLDALFIGGGFPETHADALERNGEMRAAIRKYIAHGGVVYAECGGLMYLTRAITWKGRSHDMVGSIPAEVTVEEEPVGRGVVSLERTGDHPWMTSGGFRAHEFHYSRLTGLPETLCFGLQVKRGYGIDGAHDGLVMDNVFAMYAHQRHTRQNPWINDFLNHVRRSGPVSGSKTGG